jgi:hypothetical protein
MSFMTILVFSWILFITGFCIYKEYFHHHQCLYEEVFYMIKKKEQEDFPTIIAFTAVIAAMVIPQIPQID